jgi:hypothetical protein
MLSRTHWRPAACDQHQDLALGLGGLPGIERCLDWLLDLGRCAWAFASASRVHHHITHWSEQVVWIWDSAQFLSIALSGRYSGRCAIQGPGFLTAVGDNWAAIGRIQSAYSGSKAPGFAIQYRHLDGPLRDCDGNRLPRTQKSPARQTSALCGKAPVRTLGSKARIRPIAVVHGRIRYDCNVQKAEVQGGWQKSAQQR